MNPTTMMAFADELEKLGEAVEARFMASFVDELEKIGAGLFSGQRSTAPRGKMTFTRKNPKTGDHETWGSGRRTLGNLPKKRTEAPGKSKLWSAHPSDFLSVRAAKWIASKTPTFGPGSTVKTLGGKVVGKDKDTGHDVWGGREGTKRLTVGGRLKRLGRRLSGAVQWESKKARAKHRAGRLRREGEAFRARADELSPIAAAERRGMNAAEAHGTAWSERDAKSARDLAERKTHQADRLAKMVGEAKPHKWIKKERGLLVPSARGDERSSGITAKLEGLSDRESKREASKLEEQRRKARILGENIRKKEVEIGEPRPKPQKGDKGSQQQKPNKPNNPNPHNQKQSGPDAGTT